MDLLLRWVQAGSTPLLAILLYVVWQIKTNDLPHIYERLGEIEGGLDERRGRKRHDD